METCSFERNTDSMSPSPRPVPIVQPQPAMLPFTFTQQSGSRPRQNTFGMGGPAVYTNPAIAHEDYGSVNEPWKKAYGHARENEARDVQERRESMILRQDRLLALAAARNGMTIPQFIARIRERRQQQQQAAMGAKASSHNASDDLIGLRKRPHRYTRENEAEEVEQSMEGGRSSSHKRPSYVGGRPSTESMGGDTYNTLGQGYSGYESANASGERSAEYTREHQNREHQGYMQGSSFQYEFSRGMAQGRQDMREAPSRGELSTYGQQGYGYSREDEGVTYEQTMGGPPRKFKLKETRTRGRQDKQGEKGEEDEEVGDEQDEPYERLFLDEDV
jgi:hypothetical protein